MNKLAHMGRNGCLITVAEGFHPGSEVANMPVLRYNLPKVYEGHGPLETASIGVDLKSGETAMRCNLIYAEGEILKNHSSGHVSTEETDVLIQHLQKKLGNDYVRFHTGVQYCHLLVIEGRNKGLDCTLLYDVPLRSFRPLMAKSLIPGAQETADPINNLIFKSQGLLKNHLLNLKRISEGKDPASSIWPWGPGYHPQMPTFSETLPQVKKGAVISAIDSINGIGYYAGLHRIAMKGATGLYNINYENKVAAALEALKTGDLVYLHIKASDEARHERDIDLKLLTIEGLDKHVVGPIYEAVRDWDEPVAVAVLLDHPAPCEPHTHASDPIPFLVWCPGIEPNEVQTYNEISAYDGSYGVLKGDGSTKRLMNRKNIQ